MSGSPRLAIELQVETFNRRLEQEFGQERFLKGYCLLLGRHYGQSKFIYFSLNPGLPRSGNLVSPSSTGSWNVPFRNPPNLLREYVYLQNCQRFFSSDPELDRWINQSVSSAFLVPWRTRNMSELLQLNATTKGRLFEYSRQLVRTMMAEHQAELVLAAGKSALELMKALRVYDAPIERSGILGPGSTYQWSRSETELAGRKVTILQIPHFSRANSPARMEPLVPWLKGELALRGCLARA